MALVQHIAALKPAVAPVCSVCIANYNGTAILADCIDSVLAQQGGGAVEIIVHDDASTDDSVAFLRANYPQVEILASSENVGFCIGNNRMVACARAPYILLLNNDAALYPDAVRVLLSNAAARSPQGILTLPQYDWSTGDLVDRGCLLDPLYNPVPNLNPKRRDVAYVIGACLFLPRALWIELGGFPEWMGSIAEDMYLCCVARLRGFPVQAAAASGYRHRQGASFGGNKVEAGQLSTTYRRRAFSERNKTAVLIICTPTSLIWLLLAIHCTLLVFEGMVLALLKRDMRIWREVYMPTLSYVVNDVRDLSCRRYATQQTRRVSLARWRTGFTLMPRKLWLLLRYGLPRIHR